ncbi:hypothetical protein [Aquibacillus albus]|uniref:Uncharacterized protein n=1 Tax=Aquibacillus albus TaxID=1168171 RepID=A0ABS2N422_9BACI|nr:hypothetical protein [Aquibacillus albus]MBM7572877.1 hypothetical protein [Aquibacillus albus]
MFVLSRSQMVKNKIEMLNQGYSAYEESDELIRMLKREISNQQLSVICDYGNSGCWFIPESLQDNH